MHPAGVGILAVRRSPALQDGGVVIRLATNDLVRDGQIESATWNLTMGCDRVSTGCDHCYALAFATRLKARGNLRY